MERARREHVVSDRIDWGAGGCAICRGAMCRGAMCRGAMCRGAMCRGAMPPSAPSRPDNVPVTDFDFEAALSKFNKANVQQENVQVLTVSCKQD